MIYVFFFLFVSIIYGNTLHNEFLMDDYPMLIENRHISSLGFLQLNGNELSIYFRPITHLMNYITFAFFGDNPVGYHVVNIFLVYLAGVMLYLLIKKLWDNEEMAFLVAVFFYVHPINGVLVNYKNATGFPFMFMAANLSLWNYARAALEKDRSAYILAAIWLVVSLLCHEMMLIFPLYLFAFLFFSGKFSLKETLWASLPSVVITAGYLIFRTYYVNIHQNIVAHASGIKMSLASYAASFTKLISWYVNKLVSLKDIVLMWDTPPVTEGIWVWNAGLVLSVSMLIYLVIKYRSHRALSLGVVLFSLGALPVILGCLSRPWFGLIIEPHWMIYSSVGAFIVLASFFVWIKKYLPKIVWGLSLVALLSLYGISSRNYNYLWGAQVRYCQYWQTISPFNFMPQFWIAYDYLEKQNYQDSEVILESLLNRKLTTVWLYGNLGIVKHHLGKYEEATHYLNEALKQSPNDPDVMYYLGATKFFQNDFVEAEKLLKKSYALDGSLAPAKEMLRIIYSNRGL